MDPNSFFSLRQMMLRTLFCVRVLAEGKLFYLNLWIAVGEVCRASVFYIFCGSPKLAPAIISGRRQSRPVLTRSSAIRRFSF